MKTIISIFLIACLLSCTKKKDEPVPASEFANQERVTAVTDTTASKLCIYRVKNRPDSLFPGMTKDRVDSLKAILNRNNINCSNLQVRHFTDATPSAVNPMFSIMCRQLINGLLVFTDEAVFHLKKTDSLLAFGQGRIEKISIDSVPVMKEQEVVRIFINALRNDNSGHFSKDSIPNACFKLEPGYYNLNAGTGTTIKKYARCWLINAAFKPSGVRPSAYINDETSTIIRYSTGVIE